MGQGDIVNPYAWQDQSAAVPPSYFNNIPPGAASLGPGQAGDGRYWWQGNANTPPPVTALVLLHADGADGSTAFVDSSPNTWTVSAVGAARMLAVAAKFGTAGYSAGAIGANTSGNLSIAHNAAFTFGTSDFTVEFWVNRNNGGDSSQPVHKVFGSSVFPFVCDMFATGVVRFQSPDTTGTTQVNLVTPALATTGWNHIAYVRRGSIFSLYLNGVSVASSTFAGAVGDNTVPFIFGSQSFSGNPTLFDEWRISKTAVYAANFTPPTAPFAPVQVTNYMQFIGDTADFVGNMVLTWQELQFSSDGSAPVIAYSINGNSLTTVQLPRTSQGLQSGAISVPLTGASVVTVGVYYSGGVASPTATNNILAFSVSRNANESPTWNYPDQFNPAGYNAQRLDASGNPVSTLLQLRTRLMYRLGFAAQAANPPPGMVSLLNDFLLNSQNYLYLRYPALNTQRWFRWRVIPTQRFYSLKDNDDDVLSSYKINPNKTIEWVGIQDNRNVWYPLIEGIPPETYTMLQKPWRPSRYAIRQAIELYPMPDQTYWLWMRANFGLLSFASDSDQCTIDSELVFMHALANAKFHYGQPDAKIVEDQAGKYMLELVAATHKTARYIPGTRIIPAAVRPTLLHYQS